MTGVSFERVKQLLAGLREVEPSRRSAWLERHCGGDRALHDEVLSLLRQSEREPDFLESPAIDVAGLFDDQVTALGGTVGGLAPTRVGRYRIVRCLGAGGMGVVYEAEQDRPRRRVALKMLRPGLVTRQSLRRFRREAELLGRLHHPGIVQIHDAGMVDLGAGEQPYFAMEFVQGRPLTTHAAEEGLDTRARLALFLQLCDAVHHAHDRGVLHRDLKPDNILVTDEPGTATGLLDSGERVVIGQVRVLDFGVGRATDAADQSLSLGTSTGQLLGTLPYMSPEQVAGDGREFDARSDVYALGVVLFELLVGRLPHDLSARPVPEAARLIREEEPVWPPALDTPLRGDLRTIVAKALEKDPGRRYATAAELGADVLRLLRHEPIAARPASTLYQLRKFASRHRGLVAGVVVAFVCLAGGLAASIVFALGEAEQRVLATQREADARFEAYRASLATASTSDSPVRALKALTAAPEESRGWEYDLLAARADPVLLDVPSPGAADGGTLPSAIAWLPDGGPVQARAGDGTLSFVALETGAESRVDDLPGDVVAIALSDDGRRIATITRPAGSAASHADVGRDEAAEDVDSEGADAVGAGAEGADAEAWRLRVWERADGTSASRVLLDRDVPGGTTGLALSADGSRVGIACGQVDAELLDVAHGAVIAQQSARVVASSLTFGREAPAPLFAAARSGLYRLTDSGSTRLCGIPVPYQLAVDPTGRLLALPATSGVHVRDMDEADNGFTLGDGFVMPHAMSFSRDGRLLACAIDRRLEVWDLSSRSLVRTLPAPPEQIPAGASLAFDPTGRRLLARTTRGARIWDLGGKVPLVLAGHATYVYEAVFSPDGRLVASAGGGGEVRLWDAWSGECLARLPCPFDVVMGLAFSADGTRILATVGSGTCSWDVGAGADSLAVQTTVREGPASRWSSEHVVAYWSEAASGARTTTLSGFAQAETMTDEIEMAAYDGAVRVRRRDTGREFQIDAAGTGPHGGGAWAVAVSPDGRLLATGSADGRVSLWDSASGGHLADLSGHAGRIYSLDFSPDGTRLASGGRDRTVRIWHVERRQELLELAGHSDYVHSVRWSPDGTQLATSSGDGSVRLWDAEPLEERNRRRLADREREERMSARVRELLDEGREAVDAAAALRAEPSLSVADRAAALRVLLREVSRR